MTRFSRISWFSRFFTLLRILFHQIFEIFRVFKIVFFQHERKCCLFCVGCYKRILECLDKTDLLGCSISATHVRPDFNNYIRIEIVSKTQLNIFFIQYKRSFLYKLTFFNPKRDQRAKCTLTVLLFMDLYLLQSSYSKKSCSHVQNLVQGEFI